jgi:hypothetical protein
MSRPLHVSADIEFEAGTWAAGKKEDFVKSYEALKRCIGPFTERIAKALNLSKSLIYKMQEPTGGFYSGKLNFLDRAEMMIKTSLSLEQKRSDALAPLHYLCQQFGGFYVEIPEGREVKDHTQGLLSAMTEIGEWTAAHSKALENNKYEAHELPNIRQQGYEAACQIIACIKHAEENVNE